MDIRVNDILVMKKPHPCGEKRWLVLRTGADFRLRCLGCGHELEISDPKQAVEEQIMDAQQAMAVHRVLHDLPEPYKEVFSLRVFGQLSFGDIGSLFGRTANWACVTYHRARQKIRDEMGEYV